ncbi:TetR/AcrR family transcriptional regulator [Xanthomonas floridensis]|uniref:Transcriptional regulator n=1 Tax=Xanthomonas floridensis TaxID=1843580 RepID=A0A1A9M8X9_9XANT|nr:TetR/AcrR family transcriptional regulator [Xanthomonas floridensis]MEA5126267.1 TetR/AcrR family transcriptional regulator [Xanthomonas floridensis]MEA5134157.1 TetR/AcrR family transcriptional regulator [Xanthomonas floridensis]OAG66572.1 transcriptional regulator [Xanthomonas floridensis]
MKKTALKPRKIPAQARSRATVDAIVQAATYILTKVGWDGLTTNAIAERAGVNIASLYQFFPNKQAIIAELQRRHANHTHADLREILMNLPEQPALREVLVTLVRLLIDEHRIAPALHRAIHDELPRTARLAEHDNQPLRDHFMEAIRPLMRNVPDPDLAICMVSMSAHAIIHTVTAERPALLDDPHFAEELVTLFNAFLDRPAG